MKSWLLAAGLTLVLAAPAGAERAVGLEEAIHMALRGNPSLKASREALEATRAGVGSARSHLLPSLTFEERYMRTDNPTYAFMSKLNQGRFAAEDFAISSLNDPDEIEDYQTSLSIEQPLFAPPAWYGLKMARKEAEAAELALRRLEERTVLETVRAYLNVSTARQQLAAAEQGLEEAREHSRIARARFDAGLGVYSDTLRTGVFVKEAEERRLRAAQALRLAGRALGLVLGLAEPVGILDTPEATAAGDLDEHLAAARQRADIASMAARVQNAENALSSATSGYLPTVGVGGTYQWNDPDDPLGSEGESYRVAAFLRWDIFDGTRRRSERARARHQVREAEEHLEGLGMHAGFEVYRAYLDVEEAQARLDLAHSREELAAEGVRIVSARYENALSTVVELLDSQTALDQARAGAVAARNSYLAALAELRFASGLILESYLPGSLHEPADDETGTHHASGAATGDRAVERR